MTQTLRFLARLLPWPLLVIGFAFGTSCHRPEDCELLDTCPGSLVARAVKLADDKEKARCRRCIEQRCEAETRECELDFACNFSARCRLKTSPSEYQACLQDMHEAGLTAGHERRFPWEGLDENPFTKCFQAHCRGACIDDPFACGEMKKETEYQDLKLKVAVRMYRYNDPVRQVNLQLCDDDDGPDATLEEDSRDCTSSRTDDEGIASFDRPFISVEGLYFDIEGQRGSVPFPRTIYYPGRLGKNAPPRQNDPQLLAIYVVSEQLIQSGNNILGRGYKVLQDAAQSLVLTDTCLWDEIAAPDLYVDVVGADVPQCHLLPNLCDETGCTPCVWYTVGDVPDRFAQRTNDKGAGIVGLPEGFYTIRVQRTGQHGERKLVSRRPRIRMENGAMTIVRTWPAP